MQTTKRFERTAWILAGLLVAGTFTFFGVGRAAEMEQGPPGPRGPRHGRMMERLFEELDVTEAQQVDIKGIRERYREPFEETRTKLMEARRALEDLVWSGAEEGAVRMKAVDVATIEEELAVLRAAQHAAVRQILTPEQREELDALKAKWEANREDRRPFLRRPGRRPRMNR